MGEEGDKNLDPRSGMEPWLLVTWEAHVLNDLQDNAGKTTLLYRLKVCPLCHTLLQYWC